MRRPRPAAKLLTVGLTLVIGSAGLGFLAGGAVRSPAQVLADTAPPRPTVLTEAVTYGKATRSVTFDGTVEPELVAPVPAPAVATDSSGAVVTRLPQREGDVVRAGALVAEVSGRPVLVLRGRIPSFRTMAPGASGRDVRQLQDGLRSAGLPVGDPDGSYGPSTAAAVAALYERHGYDAVVTGEEEVETATLTVREAQRTLEQARGAGDRSTTRYAAEDLARAQEALTQARISAGAQVPAGEIAFVPSLPATVTHVDVVLGGPAEGSLLALAAGRLVVRGEPRSADLRGLRRGAAVELLLAPEGRTTGRVSSVLAVSAAGTETDGDAGAAGDVGEPGGRTVTVVPSKRLSRARAGAAVRVIVTVAQSSEESLLVPVSAVSSSADGTTHVTVVEGEVRRQVAVTAGFLGDGVVQVSPTSGGGLALGDRVAIGLEARG